MLLVEDTGVPGEIHWAVVSHFAYNILNPWTNNEELWYEIMTTLNEQELSWATSSQDIISSVNIEKYCQNVDI